MKQTICIYIIIILIAQIYSCANIGSPNGGPYDEMPPKFISSKPVPNQLNFKGKTVEILFDELITLDKPSENVIITPPQLQLPVIMAEGRKAVVELRDTLKTNTTYTIDFTNSIADNNEKNVLENFTFAFSTGNAIDTLEISGYLLNADNLEPVQGIIVGLHSNLDDSAFTTEPFTRTSKTNDRGHFIIRNIAEGTYRLFALNDKNRDYKFDQPGEDIAFSDSLVSPTFEFTTRQDTLWKDSLTVDTVITRPFTRFTPDNLVLRLFKEKFERQYALRHERTQENRFTLRFNAPLDTVLAPAPLNFAPADSAWYITQWDDAKASIHYWITDSMVWKQDTLKMAITYPQSDSMNIPRPRTDTLTLNLRTKPQTLPKLPKKGEAEEEEPTITFLKITVKASGDIFDTLSISFDEPVINFPKEAIRFEQQADTLWTPAEFDMVQDTLNTLTFFLMRKWNYQESFRLEIDSATIQSVYGKWNDKISQQLNIKSRDQYGHLFINILDIPDTIPAFAELLDASDKAVRKVKLANGGALFMDILPGKYAVRLVIDENGNNIWDTGNYSQKQQPEAVYYYTKIIEIKPNWEIEENWNILYTPLYQQKPLDITKNKPKEINKPRRDYKNEGKSKSASSPVGRNLQF
ncbi:MAG: Ig-like domain-containing protein [Tannerellaceae bacterium]|jgi:uncharacterized protein (DUF2141 family)|nr:Ig-like domain-containing protein [Tannerellaceae bacterium]